MKRFPDELLFGVTTSAFQTEGASREYGKGESIWDRLLDERPELVRDGSDIGIAADAYHMYGEDIKLIKTIKFDVYKFSISWSRILPDGTISNVNRTGIDHYRRLIDAIIDQDIIPMVTMYHFDLPAKLQEIGGWCNPLLVEYFADYADLLFQLFGDKVKWWTTINEPLEIVHGYADCRYAPYLPLECLDADYIVGRNLLMAHAKVYHLYREKFFAHQKGKISIILSGMNFVPKSKCEEDEKAAFVARQFTMGWFAHPIYSKEGDYPAVMRKLVDENSKKEGKSKSKLPRFSPQEIEQIKGSSDFFAFNHYTSMLASSLIGEGKSTTFRMRDAKVALEIDKNWPATGAFWCKVAPFGLKEMLLWIGKEYGNPPIYIYENGFCDNNGQLEDIDRIDFFKSYLHNLWEAITEHGCNIIGYNIWTLVDAFEWLNGYSHKYGIVHVNYQDSKRIRTLKLSALFWKDVCHSRCIPEIIYHGEYLSR